ncbi:ABC transporter ATP-binding protein [Natronorubrum thiooxidans]|uniref:Molybdate/tungstate import ATP-binding protein WtpC n=1 Tax=Natronorubrum thiooxidans TaxID=308853 RepID=A0A1N7GRR5_9EURY|nr:ABC transporter ATP-binding protein [Natronorubrum thiooxidans]SIS15246.1 putative spermidine/putrescine transport system ATP-binding protein/molybdate/tungstate transport system ATP-binding protein [Natronorubrum thiooxidans]
MILELEELSHRYGTELAVDDVSFGLESGELVALLGPSGCGKTTIVQAVAGHVRPTAGRVVLRGDDVTDTPPESRRVGIVFQQPTLYPHMTVSENVAYGLAPRDIDPDRRDELVDEYLDLVALHEQRTAYPAELSGGQQRRVELARALAPQPDVLVLDEPLSALDRTLREQLRDEIARIQRETGVTTLFVTHDQEEAMALADRLVVMNDGQVAGVGQPRTLYESPPTPFVASFLGRSNTLSATVVDQHPLTITLGTHEIRLDGTARDFSAGTPVTCHIRPKDLSLRSSAAPGTTPSLPCDVVHVADLGRRYDVTVQSVTGDELVVEQSGNPPATGETITVVMPQDSIQLFGPEQQ